MYDGDKEYSDNSRTLAELTRRCSDGSDSPDDDAVLPGGLDAMSIKRPFGCGDEKNVKVNNNE